MSCVTIGNKSIFRVTDIDQSFVILDRWGSSFLKDILIFSVQERRNEKEGSPFKEEQMVDPFLL